MEGKLSDSPVLRTYGALAGGTDGQKGRNRWCSASVDAPHSLR